jgi:hypothetical protein
VCTYMPHACLSDTGTARWPFFCCRRARLCSMSGTRSLSSCAAASSLGALARGLARSFPVAHSFPGSLSGHARASSSHDPHQPWRGRGDECQNCRAARMHSWNIAATNPAAMHSRHEPRRHSCKRALRCCYRVFAC